MRALFTLGFVALLLAGAGILMFGAMDVDVPQTDVSLDIPLDPPAAAPTQPEAPTKQVIQ